MYSQIIISHWINIFCGVHCREKILANVIVATDLKNKTVHLFFFFILKRFCEVINHYLCSEAVVEEGKRTNIRGTEEILNGKDGLI